jgi:hypothetical protein
VAGRQEAQIDIADAQGFAVAERLLSIAGTPGPHAHGHDGQRLCRGENGGVAWPGVVGVSVGDDGPRDGTRRVDEEVAGPAIEPLSSNAEPGVGMSDGILLMSDGYQNSCFFIRKAYDCWLFWRGGMRCVGIWL